MDDFQLSETDIEQFERLITGLLEGQYGLCDDFLDAATTEGLRDNLLAFREAGLMHPAGVGKHFDYVKNTNIRGDVIRWIDPASKNKWEAAFMQKVERLVHYLNSTCYTGITDYEFHYAYYEVNSFYKRHLDQFRADRGRKFSFVTYLNDHWQPTDGGKLSLYLPDQEIDILPMSGRAVFFKSDETEHEVHPSTNRARLSIAGWLKS